MVQQRILTTEVLPYVYKHLSIGRRLSSLLMNVDFSRGKFWTYVPLEVSERDAYALSRRSDVALLKARADLLMIDLIEDFLRNDTLSFCILEDALAFPTDPFLLDVTYPRYFVVGNDVYYYLSMEDADREKIRVAMRTSRSFLFTAVLTTASSNPRFQPKAQLSENDLRDIVDGLEKIIMSAYDGTGYLIWDLKKE